MSFFVRKELMQTDSNSSADQRSAVVYLRWLVFLALIFVVGGAVFAVMALNKLDRVVVVVENVNAKVDRAAEAAAPLGKAAVERGVEALEAVDTNDLGRSATEGLKDIGRTAKQRAIEALKKKRAGDENGQ
jgi:hypothetical protein